MDNFTETKLGKFKWEVGRGYAETRETKSLVAYPTSIEECLELIEVCKKNGLSICPRGNGYTYGDMILNDGQVILDLSHMDRILSWNEDQGVIIVQPGARFSDIFSTVLPYNWSLSSCPGGMGITIGGAVSNNVHGKDSWKQGNFGDHKFCRDGVWELRVSVGVGYRVYYAQSGSRVILLLCGGDKRTQDADIERAVKYWRDWQRRPDDEK